MLSGCGTISQAGAAAVIGDRRISVSDVQDGYNDIVPLVGADAGVTQAQILNLLILEPYLTEAASDLGLGVSTEDAKLSLSSSGSIDTDDLTASGIEVWRANLANSALQTDRSTKEINATYTAIEKELKAADVEINPRYGDGIDYSTFTITQSTPNWVESTATPTATATP